MSDVNLQLVREFFELNLFRVMTNWQQDPCRLSELSSQLFVENTNPGPALTEPDFLLRANALGAVDRAVVEIRAWHADRFYPSVIDSNPVLSQFVAEDALALATELFHGEPFRTILVLSELPVSQEPRQRSIDLLRRLGMDHVIEFPVVLQGLLQKVSINAHYPASQTLQTLRLLKRYRFIRNQQMEFGFRPEAPPQNESVHIETTSLIAEDSADD